MLIDMTRVAMTTIKVSKRLRERVSREAEREGLTAGGLISELLDERERRARFHSVRRAYATVDSTYADETAQWDSLAGDALDV